MSQMVDNGSARSETEAIKLAKEFRPERRLAMKAFWVLFIVMTLVILSILGIVLHSYIANDKLQLELVSFLVPTGGSLIGTGFAAYAVSQLKDVVESIFRKK